MAKDERSIDEIAADYARLFLAVLNWNTGKKEEAE
jgi:hypothetical protein